MSRRAAIQHAIKVNFGPLLTGIYRFLPVAPVLRLVRTVNQIQLSSDELDEIVRTIRAKPGCALLVFGVGNDSALWMAANKSGKTVFLENSPEWQAIVQRNLPSAEIHTVLYRTTVRDFRTWLARPSDLAMELPASVRATQWDIILVDAPPGWREDMPGRMQSVYEASRLVAPGGHVFVHDCHREAERVSCDTLLVGASLVSEIGYLRHYVHRHA